MGNSWEQQCDKGSYVHPKNSYEGIHSALCYLGSRWQWVVNAMPQSLYPWEIYPVPIAQYMGPLESVLTGTENLVPIGIRSPDRPARSELLFRLCYPELFPKFVYTRNIM
jgi:hypothetical protein